jgi:hypothetical protein
MDPIGAVNGEGKWLGAIHPIRLSCTRQVILVGGPKLNIDTHNSSACCCMRIATYSIDRIRVHSCRSRRLVITPQCPHHSITHDSSFRHPARERFRSRHFLPRRQRCNPFNDLTPVKGRGPHGGFTLFNRFVILFVILFVIRHSSFVIHHSPLPSLGDD